MAWTQNNAWLTGNAWDIYERERLRGQLLGQQADTASIGGWGQHSQQSGPFESLLGGIQSTPLPIFEEPKTLRQELQAETDAWLKS